MTRPLNPVFANRPVSIFPTMTALARETGAINLGQGFPDEDGPREVLEAAARALVKGPNQYAPIEGLPELRQAVARASRRFYGLDIDWRSEALVVAGATEGLAAAFLSFLNPGDEVVVFSPFYESYAPQIEAAGATPVFVSLKAPGWRIEAEALERAISPRTKALVLNSPHNPTGRVLDAQELEVVADACRRHDLVAICDEVYEHMTFDGRPHTPLMTLPGMRERTIRFGSAGKTFSLTGWRIGYATGPERLVTALKKAHQFIAYTCPSHLQIAVAQGLDLGDGYYQRFTRSMQEKRDRLAAGLKRAGFETLPCEGAYFLSVDIRSVGREDDRAFCEEIARRAGVAAVPVSAFLPHGDAEGPRAFARFCFAKRREVLDEASRRLAAYFAV